MHLQSRVDELAKCAGESARMKERVLRHILFPDGTQLAAHGEG